MNYIIPELIDLNHLDLEEVNTICGLNEYYHHFCQKNKFIQNKLYEARLKAETTINRILSSPSPTFNLNDIRKLSYYQYLLDYHNIPFNSNQLFYKDHYVHLITIRGACGNYFVIEWMGKKNNNAPNIYKIANDTSFDLEQLKTLLIYFYYNQIL